jgi:uncharacterized protein
VAEMVNFHGQKDENRLLERRLLFGLYPEVINSPGNEARVLRDISKSYLFRDLFTFREIRKPELLEKLLIALALQMGNIVSYSELGNTIGTDQLTVQRYLDLLEKSFVIFRLTAFSRNLRTELKKSRKIYFYDNGIRNAILNNFLPLETRPDTDALWENFLISERLKNLNYQEKFPNTYFWRTQKGEGIDYLEEIDGKINTFEFKWNPARKANIPFAFAKSYPNTDFVMINPSNYHDFLKFGLSDFAT